MVWDNVNCEIRDDILILKINRTRRIKLSNTEFSDIIAQIIGNQPIPGRNNLRITLNVYEPR
jgi:hypothetical protein